MPIEIESPEEVGYGNIHINLAESSAYELDLRELGLDLNGIKPEYTDHRGHPTLRKLIAEQGEGLNASDVLLTGGAAMAMYFVYSSLLNTGDKIGIVFPNYSSNLQSPRTLGYQIIQINLRYEENWELPLAEVEKAALAGARMISLTTPHNPTGNCITKGQINDLLLLTSKYKLILLFDETYRDACFESNFPLLASFHNNWISLISFSKGYGLPGIRIGAIITKNKTWYETFLAAKETIQICNPPLEEAIAYAFYTRRLELVSKMNAKAQINLGVLKAWLNNENRVEAVLPQGGLVCFVRIKKRVSNLDHFYKFLFEQHGLVVGPGHWFDMDDKYMRIGFGYPEELKLKAGLKIISSALDEY